jgi:uncharacterized tellurite resistance protein B-like protein
VGASQVSGGGGGRGGSASFAGLDLISQRLAHLEPRSARYLACFASVLARVAHADASVAQAERAEMARRISALAELDGEQADAVVTLAVDHTRELATVDRERVTGEFRSLSTPLQRTELFFCLYAVASADGFISDHETREIDHIADELGVARTQASGIRADRRFVSPGG